MEVSMMANKAKHFVISVKSAAHIFTYECTGAYEAMEAIVDAARTFGFNVDNDDVMESLVSIKNGNLLSRDSFRWSVALKDGEI
jgi:hypothetical protein